MCANVHNVCEPKTRHAYLHTDSPRPTHTHSHTRNQVTRATITTTGTRWNRQFNKPSTLMVPTMMLMMGWPVPGQ